MNEVFMEYVLPAIAAFVGLSGVVATFRYFIKSKMEIVKSAKAAAKETIGEIKGRIEADMTPLVTKQLSAFTDKIEKSVDIMTGAIARLTRVQQIISENYRNSLTNTPELQAELECLVDEVKELCKPAEKSAMYVFDRASDKSDAPQVQIRRKQGR